VEKAIRDVCLHRNYFLHAISVRTNHVHTVVSAASKPEPVMNAFKAYATRELRNGGLLNRGTTPWSRHGSTRYLWKERHVEKAIDYVLYGQGDELPSLDDGGLSVRPRSRSGWARTKPSLMVGRLPRSRSRWARTEPSLMVGLLPRSRSGWARTDPPSRSGYCPGGLLGLFAL
jgi:hypothetical protein